MTADWSHAITAVISGAVGLGTAWITRLGQKHDSDRAVDARREEHIDGVFFELLDAMKKERAAMQAELERWQSIAAHLADFDLALVYIEALLVARTQQERDAVERSARAFLDRVEVKRRAHQQIRAEAQLGVSAAHVNEQPKKGS